MVLFSENLTFEKKIASILIKQAPGQPGVDFVSRNQLNKLRDRQEPTGNNNLSPSPPAVPLAPGQSLGPFLPPPPPFIPSQPPSAGFYKLFQPTPPRSDNSFGNFYIPAQLSSASFNSNNRGLYGNLFGSQTQTLTRGNKRFKIGFKKN